MPPVFGPWSWSNTRLWSCAEASAIAVSPSDSAKKLISRPARNSSITTSAPAAPNAPSNIMAIASSASRKVMRDHHALARRKPVGLDHDRRALRADIGQRVGGIGEAAIGAGRNAEFGAERLGKSLGALELRSLLARPERLDAGAVEIVDDPGRERRFRADHDEIDRVALAEIDHRGMVGDIERHAFGFPRDAGIARRAPEFRHQRRGRDLPRQSVFAAAGTEQKNVHGADQMEVDETESVARTSALAARGLSQSRHSGRRACAPIRNLETVWH